MFIAHAPAGYLMTHMLAKVRAQPSKTQTYLFGIFVSICPDLDLIYFYGVDGRQTHHHHYIPHLPIVWAGIYVILLACLTINPLHFSAKKKASCIFYAHLMFCCMMLHMFLDTLVGGIAWLYPWSKNLIRLIEVSRRYDMWVLNFIVHWTFLAELCIIAAALWVWIKSSKHTPGHIQP